MHHRRDIPALVLAAALGCLALSYQFFATAWAQVDSSQVSTIVYPPQELPLRFSHSLHLGQLQADCEDCHSKIASSASSLDNNLPREESCRSCHEIDRKDYAKNNGPGRAPGNCAACHLRFDEQVGRVERVRLPIPNLKFSHQAHLQRKAQCQDCHGDLVRENVGLATRAQLPTMQDCVSCHDGKKASDACISCHISQAGAIVKTEFAGLGSLQPSGVLRGAAHDLNFRQSHKYAAQNDQDFCASFHKKKFCVDCHNGVTKPMDFHAGDYISMHSIDARRNSSDCSSCHRIQTFCQGCHSRMGVAADRKLLDGMPLPGSYHPPGWVGSGLAGRSPNDHSFEAQRNIKQCASCHRESFCTKCHSNQASSLRINPHPRDWRGSRRCEALRKRNYRMCLRCHVEAQGVDCQ